jgi:hypothetical protein
VKNIIYYELVGKKSLFSSCGLSSFGFLLSLINKFFKKFFYLFFHYSFCETFNVFAFIRVDRMAIETSRLWSGREARFMLYASNVKRDIEVVNGWMKNNKVVVGECFGFRLVGVNAKRFFFYIYCHIFLVCFRGSLDYCTNVYEK